MIARGGIIIGLVLVFAAAACGGAPEPPPPTPVVPGPLEQAAFRQAVRTAGSAVADGLTRDDPEYQARMQQHYDAFETWMNAWRRENWALAQQDPSAYEATIAVIECQWWGEYWRANGVAGQPAPHWIAPEGCDVEEAAAMNMRGLHGDLAGRYDDRDELRNTPPELIYVYYPKDGHQYVCRCGFGFWRLRTMLVAWLPARCPYCRSWGITSWASHVCHGCAARKGLRKGDDP